MTQFSPYAVSLHYLMKQSLCPQNKIWLPTQVQKPLSYESEKQVIFHLYPSEKCVGSLQKYLFQPDCIQSLITICPANMNIALDGMALQSEGLHWLAFFKIKVSETDNLKLRGQDNPLGLSLMLLNGLAWFSQIRDSIVVALMLLEFFSIKCNHFELCNG